MSALQNFPMLSQRDSDKNADFDCVPASIAACLEYLTGKKYTAGQVKDAVYGADYVGGTDAHKFVDYCLAQGVSLTAIDGNGSQLVASLHSMISSGHPCLITEPDPYLAGWSHVCAAYACDDASITVMDPWIDQPVKKPDGTWASQLLGNEIWVLEKGTIPPDKKTWINPRQESQAGATWNSTTIGLISGDNMLASLGIFESGKTPAYTTGIAQSWQAQYMGGKNYGPPVSYEFSAVNGKPLTDWDGNPIAQQNFLGGRCEWNLKDHTAHWYPWT